MPLSVIIQIFLIIFLILGIILVIVSFFLKGKRPNNDEQLSDAELIKMNNLINNSIREANKTIRDINELSEYIMNEINKKYKELLFLYDIIDQKGKDVEEKIKKQSNKEPKKESKINLNDVNNYYTDNENVNSYDRIISMYKEGKDIPQIAKELSIGIGEVKLIVDLYSSKL